MDTKNLKAVVNALIAENYSFDVISQTWKCGKIPVEEWNIQEFIILWAREHTTIRDKGVFAVEMVNAAKIQPEITYQSFTKKCTARNRCSRLIGKHLFAAWCKATGILIEGSLESFMIRNSLLVKRFYDLLANGMNCIKKRARIFGGLASNVFIGWALREDEEEEEVIATSSPSEVFVQMISSPSISSRNTNPTRMQWRRQVKTR